MPKISALTAATSVGSTDTFAVVQGGETKRLSYSGLLDSADNVTVGGVKQYRKSYHPPIVHDSAVKALWRFDTNTYYALTPAIRGGYVLASFKNNVTTNSESLASTTSDTTMWRVAGLLRAVECLTGYTTASGTSGTWAATSITAGVPTHTSGEYYEGHASSSVGAYREYTVTVPDDGFVSVSLLRQTGGTTDVDIQIDGVDVETAISLSGSALRITKKYTTTPGSRVIKVINQAGSGTLTIIGVNFAPLRLQREDVDVDTIGFYRNSAYKDPLTNNSANDYAIYDYTAGKWGGSYHGGESSISSAFYVDETTASLASGQMAMGRTIEILQSCTVDWSGFGGATLTVQTQHFLHAGGYTVATNFTGSIRARDFFTTLFGVSTDFSSIRVPEAKAISTITNNARYALPHGNVVEYLSSANDRLRIEHSTYSYSRISEGGPFVWRVDGSYHKYYNALVTSGDLTVNQIHAVNRITLT